jgi:hypothetical protein
MKITPQIKHKPPLLGNELELEHEHGGRRIRTTMMA